MFNFVPYNGKRNEELNKEFWNEIALAFLPFALLVTVFLLYSLLTEFTDKSQADIYQNSPAEYAITIDGATEYFTLYADDGVYYNTDKEMVFDASGDALLIYTGGQCTGKSTNYTIRLKMK